MENSADRVRASLAQLTYTQLGQVLDTLRPLRGARELHYNENDRASSAYRAAYLAVAEAMTVAEATFVAGHPRPVSPSDLIHEPGFYDRPYAECCALLEAAQSAETAWHYARHTARQVAHDATWEKVEKLVEMFSITWA